MKRLALAACLLLTAAAASAHVHSIRLDGAGPASDGSLPSAVICTAAGPIAAPASAGDEAQRWLALGPFLLLVGAGALRAWRRRPPR